GQQDAQPVRDRVEGRLARNTGDRGLHLESIVARRRLQLGDLEDGLLRGDAGDVGARITGVPEAVPVVVQLIGIGDQWTDIARIAGAVAIAVRQRDVCGTGRARARASLGDVARARGRATRLARGAQRAAPRTARSGAPVGRALVALLAETRIDEGI